ncbi:histone-lysine N-methyltransferase [Colletotrichum scovillei]|uniref:Histone-lysine N-methyltransferase n=1 Tax=Colletotrichum scovillei TaxID=1209932 RepID=A0A9P7R426_9PEZI|nr:histone-lysine N-methyltransferase [Colletotrichum scovillei]KAG7068878.1 histone-lysine N-methyltransferase [Colletotrichum scovillei]KAG7072834.1 histone-lysine N-methyltransferase [Colletotrichum scovillei]
MPMTLASFLIDGFLTSIPPTVYGTSRLASNWYPTFRQTRSYKRDRIQTDITDTERLPQELAAVLAAAKTRDHVALLALVLRINSVVAHTVNVVERELLSSGNVAKRKEGEIVNVLVGMVSHARKDTQIRFAGVIDEASRAGHEFAIYLERGALGVFIRELVECEKVHVLLLRNVRGIPSALGFLWCYDLANVVIDELSSSNVEQRSNTCCQKPVFSVRKIWRGT